jgi:Mg-chelatase subunit ChlD
MANSGRNEIGVNGLIRLEDKDKLIASVRPVYQRKVILLIDSSQSMDTGSKKQFATAGAIEFSVRALQLHYAVGVIGFADKAVLICKPTTDTARIQKACGLWPVTGGTYIGSGLLMARNHVEPGTEKDVIVVITDGQDGLPQETLAIASEVKAMGVEILVIGTDDADQDFIQQLASRPDLGLKVDRALWTAAISEASRLLNRG